jgi:antitoxin component YwqK of YwqJK toxin-antitoxin module
MKKFYFILFAFLAIQFLNVGFIQAQINHPFTVDGYFLIQEGKITSIPKLVDEAGNHIGSQGFNWSSFNDAFLFNSKPANGIVYSVKNQKLENLGVVKNGKKDGVWVKCLLSGDPEYLNSVKEVMLYNAGRLVTKRVKNDWEFTGCECAESGFFEFSESVQNMTGLYDENGRKMDMPYYYELHEQGIDLDFWSTIYTANGTLFNGVRYLNESGSCFVLIETFRDGSPNGLKINSVEMGYIHSFGMLSNNKKTGFWVENQYDGTPWKVLHYENDVPTGISYFFNETTIKGRGRYNDNGEMDCEGDCE